MKKAMNEIEQIIERVRKEAYLNGISEGHQAAQRIAVWYGVNHELKEPHSRETLKEWADKELSVLREKLKKKDER